MTVSIGGNIIRLAEREVAQVVPSVWQGRKVFAGVSLPQCFPPETGFREWARLLDDRVSAHGYMVLSEKNSSALHAASAIQLATGKPAIVRLLVSLMTEDELIRVRDEAAKLGICGFYFVHGSNQAGLAEEDALAIFNDVAESKTDEKPLLACSVPVPSMRKTQEEAMYELAKRINLGCQLGVLSPWIHPESSMSYLKKFEQTYKIAVPGVIQGLLPFENTRQWDAVKHGGYIISDQIQASLDQAASRECFQEASIDVEVATLKASYEQAEGISHLGACVDMSAIGDEAMEDIMMQVHELTISSKD